MSCRLRHLTITASDFAASLAFYDATLDALGMTRVVDFADEEFDESEVEAVGWGDDDEAIVWLVAGVTPTSRVHICLVAPSRSAVLAFHAAGIAAGGTSHNQPRRWAIYRRGEFNAIVADPDGNLIEAVSGE